MHLAIDGCLQAGAMLVHGLDDAFVAFFSEHGIEIHDCSIHFGVNVNRGDGDELKPFIFNTDEVLGDDFAQNFRQTSRAGVSMGGATFGLTGTRPWALFRHAYTMAQP